MLSPMFVVSEAEAAAIRAIFEQRGELSAAVELRRRFPGIGDNAQATEWARTIAGWKARPLKELPNFSPEIARLDEAPDHQSLEMMLCFWSDCSFRSAASRACASL